MAGPVKGVLVVAVVVLAPLGCDVGDGGAQGDEPVSFHLEEILRLGALEGAEEEMFGSVSGVAPTPDGGVFVLDQQAPAVRRFGADGSFGGNVGSEGSGPGEYARPRGIQPLAGGGFAVWDPETARLSFFGPEGGFVRSMSVPSSLSTGRALETDTLGRFYVRTFNIPEGWQPSDPSAEFPLAWIRLSSAGEVLDTVPIPPERVDGRWFIVQTPDGTLRPFNERTVRGLGPGGEVLHARGDHYVVLRGAPEDASGEPGRSAADTFIAREHEPVPLEGEERARWEAYQRYLERRSPGGGALPPLPRLKPAIQDLFTDRSGRIWVRPHVEARQVELRTPPGERDPDAAPPLDFREMPVYDLFAPDGRFLGRVDLPRKARVLDASGEELWLMERGEFDEQYVVRYRLVGGG